MQMNVRGGKLRMIGFQELIRPPAEVVFRCSGYFYATMGENVLFRCYYLKRVVQGKGVEHRFQIVKTVFPLSQDMQTQVNLTVGKKDHRTLFIFPAIDLIANSNGPDIIFLFEDFLQQGVQFVQVKSFEVVFHAFFMF